MWLELRTHNKKYSQGWNFTESVWAPTLKANGSKWPFWGLVHNVVKGDLIFHLKHTNQGKQFLGFSEAATDGYITNELPTDKEHEWDFSRSFYRADLKNFNQFNPVINLSDFFNENNEQLREYFQNRNGKHLFYNINRNDLKCLFGAYFSEFNEALSRLLVDDIQNQRIRNRIPEDINTGLTLQEINVRIGQQEFSSNVKENFNHKCCFPNCNVTGRGFLIGGHINRWADNEERRGRTDNGLSFCLMHDKAFEKGLFTLTEDYKVSVLNNKIVDMPWLESYLKQGENLEIKPRQIDPSMDALREHWLRIGF